MEPQLILAHLDGSASHAMLTIGQALAILLFSAGAYIIGLFRRR